MKKRTGMIFVSTLVFAGCQSPPVGSHLAQIPPERQPAHTISEVVRRSESWFWAQPTEEQIKTQVQTLVLNDGVSEGSFDMPEYLASENPFVQRLQYWLDQIDSTFRKLDPIGTKNVPHLKILVFKHPTYDNLNAFGTSLCLQTPLVFPKASSVDAHKGNLDSAADTVVLPQNNRIFPKQTWYTPPPVKVSPYLMVIPGDPTCPTQALPQDEYPGFAHWSGNEYMKCQISPEQGVFITDSSTCAVTNNKPKQSFGQKVMISTTSNYIVASSVALKTFAENEMELVAILAHEASHIFRAHLLAPADEYNYLYHQDQRSMSDLSKRPQPVSDPQEVARLNGLVEQIQTADSRQVKGLLEKVQQEKLGWYTIEQEADELGAEILDRMGIDPNYAISSLIHLGIQSAKKFPHLLSVPPQKCEALRKNNWKDSQGKTVYVNVDDFKEIHHAPCYRAYNLSQEIIRHKYQAKPGATGSFQPPGGDWKSLMKKL